MGHQHAAGALMRARCRALCSSRLYTATAEGLLAALVTHPGWESVDIRRLALEPEPRLCRAPSDLAVAELPDIQRRHCRHLLVRFGLA